VKLELEESGGLMKDLPDRVPQQAIPFRELAWVISYELQQDWKPGLVGPARRNRANPDAGAGCLVQDCKDERSGGIRIRDEALPGGRQAVHSQGLIVQKGE
jgi:hypothetical protein